MDRVRRSGRARGADRPYLDLGFRHLVFHAPGHDQERFLTLYGEECCRSCARSHKNVAIAAASQMTPARTP